MYPVPVNEIYRQAYGSQKRESQSVPWIAYDTEQYTSGSTVTLNFFRTVKASKLDSNMEQAGAFPHPQSMHVFSLGVQPLAEPGALVTASPNILTDLHRLLVNSYLEWKIGHKLQVLAPSICFPAGVGIDAAISGAGAEATDEFVANANNGLPAPQYSWWVDPVMLESMQKFEVNIYWDSSQTLTGNIKVRILLKGRLIRSVQ